MNRIASGIEHHHGFTRVVQRPARPLGHHLRRRPVARPESSKITGHHDPLTALESAFGQHEFAKWRPLGKPHSLQ